MEDNLPMCITEYHQRKKKKKFEKVSGRNGIRRFRDRKDTVSIITSDRMNDFQEKWACPPLSSFSNVFSCHLPLLKLK